MIPSLVSLPFADRVERVYERTLEVLALLTGAVDVYGSAVESGYWFRFEIVLRALAALAMIGCVLLFCMRAAHVALPRASLPLRWSAMFCFGMWIASVGFHVLRVLGVFQLPVALLSCLAFLAVALRAMPEVVPWRTVLRRERAAARRVLRLLFRGRFASINTVFSCFGAIHALRALIVPPLGWDTFTYHGPRAALWVQSGQFSFDEGPGTLSLYRNLFAGAEVLTAWTMLPFHSDLLLNIGTVVQWIGLGLATWAFARVVGLREPFAATAAGLAMFTSTMQMELNTGYVEIPLNAALFTGMALACTGLRRPSASSTVIAAMSLGVAMAAKLQGGPPATVLMAVLSVRILTTRIVRARQKLAWLGASVLCVSLPVLPWVLHAYLDTGYPLSPIPVEVLGIELGVASPAFAWHMFRPGLEGYRWELELGALRALFNPLLGGFNEALGSMAIIPFFVLPVGAAVLLRRAPVVAVSLLVAAALPVATHFSPNMSHVRYIWAVSSSRFLLTTVIIAVVISMAWCRPHGVFSCAYRRLLLAYPLTYSVLIIHWGWGYWERREGAIVGTSLALGATFAAAAVRRWPRAGPAFALALLALACSALQLRRDQTRQAAFDQSFALHSSPRGMVSAAHLVDTPEEPHRLAVTGGPLQNADLWFMYPYLGRRFQNPISYVPPTKDGGVAHFGPDSDLAARADEGAWFERLRRRKIDEVITFPPRSIEQGWMDAKPDTFARVAGDHEWGLYRVLPPARDVSHGVRSRK